MVAFVVQPDSERPFDVLIFQEGISTATGNRVLKHPWREDGPLNHVGDAVDLDQVVVKNELSFC
jgi:hypothetical protein